MCAFDVVRHKGVDKLLRITKTVRVSQLALLISRHVTNPALGLRIPQLATTWLEQLVAQS